MLLAVSISNLFGIFKKEASKKFM